MIKITIYIDVIFIENLTMNLIILYATGLICKIKMSGIRNLLASIIGASYVVIQYINNNIIINNIILRILLSIIMVYSAFGTKKIKKLIKQIIMFYLTTFTFGGVATYLIYVLKPENIIIKNGFFVGTYVLKIIYIGAILGTLILLIAFKISKNKMKKEDLVCEIKLKIKEKEKIIKAIVDTGNLLKEPITGDSVIVIEKTSLYELLPKEILNHTEEILGGDFEKIPKTIKEEYISKMKIIPFSSLGKENGMILGVKPEKIIVINNDREEEKNNAIIGIYNKPLSKKGEYSALIGIDLY